MEPQNQAPNSVVKKLLPVIASVLVAGAVTGMCTYFITRHNSSIEQQKLEDRISLLHQQLGMPPRFEA